MFDELHRQRFGVPVLQALQDALPVNLYRHRWHYKPNKRRRPLTIPRNRLRKLQNFFQQAILQYLDVHDAVHGYRKRHSNITAVTPHVGCAVLICLDAREFFQTITKDAVKQALLDQGAATVVAELIAAICTSNNKLPQGAPTSPALSNVVGYTLDCKCAETAEKYGYVYTRFVDDLILSSQKNGDVHEVEAFLDAICAVVRDGGYGIHTGKFRVAKSHQKQEALSLTLNKYGGGRVCVKPIRVKRAFKRRLRAALHQMRTCGTAEWNPDQIEGAQAFVKMVEG